MKSTNTDTDNSICDLMEIDLYHKNDAGQWMIINYGEGDTIELKSINLSFAIEQVYRGLNLTPES